MGWVVNATLWPSYTHTHTHTHTKDPMLIIQKAGWTPGLVWAGAENLTTFGIRFLDRPSCSELLYRVSCPDPKADTVTFAVRGVDLCYVNSTHLAECSTTLLENR